MKSILATVLETGGIESLGTLSDKGLWRLREELADAMTEVSKEVWKREVQHPMPPLVVTWNRKFPQALALADPNGGEVRP